MRKNLYLTEAHDLIGIVEDSIFNNINHEMEISVEELTNYWVNDLLHAKGEFPVAGLNRYLDEVETYCTLGGEEIITFKEILFHTIEPFKLQQVGQTIRHSIRDGCLEFYILRG